MTVDPKYNVSKPGTSDPRAIGYRVKLLACESLKGKRDRAQRHRSETEKSSFYRPVTSGADTEGSGRVS